MAAMRVVPSFNEFKDRAARLHWILKTAAVQQFKFKRGEKTLASGVIEAVTYRTHRRPHASVFAALAEGQRGILAALVGVVNDAGGGPPLLERHVEGIEH